MIYAAILASGSGSRFSKQTPKQFFDLEGSPVLAYSLATFAQCGEVGKIIVTASDDTLEETKKIAAEYAPGASVITGGKTRNGTMKNILTFIEKEYGIKSGDVILTHDGARPFVTGEMIEENIAAVRRCGACCTAVPAIDTIYLTENGAIADVPERSRVYHAQTPQSFDLRLLSETYASTSDDELDAMTDACTALTRKGRRVEIVPGSYDNVKITYPEDLEKARVTAQRRKKA